LNGLFSHHSGVEDNTKHNYFNEADNLVTRLKEAGYRTALIGKYLNQWYDESTGGYTPQGWEVFTALIGANYYQYRIYDNGSINNYGESPADYSTDVLGQKAVDFISSARQPFFLVFTPYAPHSPFLPAPRYLDATGDEVVLPPNVNESNRSDKPQWVKDLPERDLQEMRQNLGNQHKMLWTVDEWVKKIFTTLKARKIANKTVIIYISDNSFSHGEHRIIGKMCGYESCNHVPLLIRYPQYVGQTIDTVVSNVDIAPTIAEIAGVSLQNPDGISLVPLMEGQTEVSSRKGVLIHWGGYRYYVVPHFWGIVEGNLKYMELETGEIELYDLSTDPYELTNIAYQPENKKTIERLHGDLVGLINADGEP
jgi:arylsulfatase A-like enzyme